MRRDVKKGLVYAPYMVLQCVWLEAMPLKETEEVEGPGWLDVGTTRPFKFVMEKKMSWILVDGGPSLFDGRPQRRPLDLRQMFDALASRRLVLLRRRSFLTTEIEVGCNRFHRKDINRNTERLWVVLRMETKPICRESESRPRAWRLLGAVGVGEQRRWTTTRDRPDATDATPRLWRSLCTFNIYTHNCLRAHNYWQSARAQMTDSEEDRVPPPPSPAVETAAHQRPSPAPHLAPPPPTVELYFGGIDPSRQPQAPYIRSRHAGRNNFRAQAVGALMCSCQNRPKKEITSVFGQVLRARGNICVRADNFARHPAAITAEGQMNAQPRG
ncbi:hypothetical protein R3P38DRAFT_2762594 [Favolaschia claudopus]|uniref:Uncharacterized protein n=1 Tax=Favolaschia claudopus TaxID=2862362 RepID=A0AAW0DIH0_9AGAR